MKRIFRFDKRANLYKHPEHGPLLEVERGGLVYQIWVPDDVLDEFDNVIDVGPFASYLGCEPDELRESACSELPISRASILCAAATYYGLSNFDGQPYEKKEA